MTCSRIADFRNLSPRDRLQKLVEIEALSDDEATKLMSPGVLGLETANGMIENVIGTFELPVGVATNFIVNGREVLIPLAVEEPSVVAAASYMARLARDSGGFTTSCSEPLMRAQIQLLDIPDPHNARLSILANKQEIIDKANACDGLLNRLGGGCRDVEVHVFPHTASGPMVVAHLIVDVRDAMGANAVNTMAEAVAPLVESLSGGRACLRILSNLADLRLARAQVRLSADQLTTSRFDGKAVIEGIVEAYRLAAIDPYRAATHNKGIMNGIDPLIIATGNDWRAVEAGAHAFASRHGRYGSLSTWEKNTQGDLVGTLEIPMPVGLVGGATRTHPLAQLSLKLMGVETASELGEIAAAVGLAQNLAALRALSTEGIQKGHMALHARNIALTAGATGGELDLIVRRMVEEGRVSADRASELLRQQRGTIS
ncbi:MAG: hydroxymethylglutaryl-CoA reductase, degradative [Salinicola sp.]|uniref:hydroxymethylglutaryl-CoA reductase, degradative n=1 Tax=uncultured Salinicola sp. TaxID=1193542 RepID=UPI000C8C78FA|nr:hydroxymethylglutaryl-CoA reductase, degradative [uncultured Salinicola sp.]MAM57756.1 hydroxymethylglutaryl-CoA reductase, degradative [Salinicola sp.]